MFPRDFYFPVIQKYWHGICFQYPYDGCTENSSHFKHWDFKFFDLFIKRTFLRKIWPFKKRYTNYLMTDFNHKSVQEVDLITGAFMLIRKELFDDVRGFDERYFLWMEDVDFCREVKKLGYDVVYNPDFLCLDYIGQSFKQENHVKRQRMFYLSALNNLQILSPFE